MRKRSIFHPKFIVIFLCFLFLNGCEKATENSSSNPPNSSLLISSSSFPLSESNQPFSIRGISLSHGMDPVTREEDMDYEFVVTNLSIEGDYFHIKGVINGTAEDLPVDVLTVSYDSQIEFYKNQNGFSLIPVSGTENIILFELVQQAEGKLMFPCNQEALDQKPAMTLVIMIQDKPVKFEGALPAFFNFTMLNSISSFPDDNSIGKLANWSYPHFAQPEINELSEIEIVQCAELWETHMDW